MPFHDHTPDYENDIVYFMQRERDGIIKIGTTRNIRSRKAMLQAAERAHYVVLGYLKGSLDLERELQVRFREYGVQPPHQSARKVVERFLPAQEILDFIANETRHPSELAWQTRLPYKYKVVKYKKGS